MTTAEDRLTELLWTALRSLGADETARFCASVCGVGLRAESLDLGVIGTRDWDPPTSPTRGLVVGISADGRLVKTNDGSWAEGRPDAAIWDTDVLIMFEFKLPRGGGLVRSQLLRHASHARLALDWDSIDVDDRSLPDGVTTRTWADVLGWLSEVGDQGPETRTCRELEQALVEHGAAPVDRPPHFASALFPRIPTPTSVDIRAIQRDWNLSDVRTLCTDRYGSEPVTADDCPADTYRMREAFRSVGRVPPPGLRFAWDHAGAMTPERTLSLAYSGRAVRIRNALPATLGGFRDRTLMTGADRHFLVALLAWAGRASGEYPKRVSRFVPTIWPEAPERAPGLEELQELLAPARRR